MRKIADRIQVIVAEMLERRVKDPRLGFVTVTDVRVTGDSQQATVFYTVLGDARTTLASTRGRAGVGQGLIRSEVGQAARHAARPDADLHPRRPAGDRPPPRRGARAGPAAGRGGGGRAAGATYAGEADPYKKPHEDDDDDARRGRPDDRVTAQSGLVVVDKPGGMTSHDVVARVRRLAGTRKVGHAGTLDPMATGVLVLGVNRATRLLGHLMLTEKAYDATIRLGVATTTDDAEGEVTATAADRPPRRGGRPGRPRGASSATSSRCRPRCRRSRSTASAPTSGSGTARRSSSRPGRSRSTSSTCTTQRSRAARRRRLGALLQRHLHPRDRPRPGRRRSASAGT